MLEAKKVNLIYKDGKQDLYALKDFSVSFPEKGFFGILGPSGSGKTSLLYVLSGLRLQSSGEVLYQGASLPHSAKKRNQLRRASMGFVFQFHFLINYLTAEQNIRVGMNKDSSDSYIKTITKRLGIDSLLQRKPYELSGGERQRVAIARAIANKPTHLFVDEPTASLDSDAGKDVIDLLHEIAKNSCVIVVTHDETNLKAADQIIRMRDGEIRV